MKSILLLLFLLAIKLNAQEIDSNKVEAEAKFEHNLSNPKKFESYIIPSLFVSYGVISLGNNAIRDLDFSTKAELSEDHPKFAAHIDDYIEFSPLFAMYGLDIAGIKSKNKVGDQSAMVLMTTVITTAVITTLKHQVHRLRPDGSSYNSFPSGHTATAFAAAELFNQEFKGQSPWFGYAGYTIASATGILRMYNNKHWLSDVVAGAGFGILSTKLTYVIYPYLKKIFKVNERKLSIAPAYQNGSLGFGLGYKLN
ncbi:phosphatase PAP2 family protein [Pedobacter frigiditerrae]|nr:phosphatase PAP2 family protein [Pedobacter frigiditerrae]